MAKSKINDDVFVQNLINDFKQKKLARIYCFDGEESFYIQKLEEAFEQEILNESERDFGLSVFYGREADWRTVLNSLQQVSMFGGLQLVMIKEASDFKELKELEPHLHNIPAQTTLFISYKHKKMDGRSTLFKKINDLAVYHRFDRIQDYQIAQWIKNYCKQIGLTIDDEQCELLAINLGNDLQKIVNEIAKVQLNLNHKNHLSAELIEKYIGISKEYNVFEYTKAILHKDKNKAYRILQYALANPKALPTTPLIANLFSSFSTIYAFHNMQNPDANSLSASLGVNYYAAKDCAQSARYYSKAKAKEAIYLLKEFALAERGVNTQIKDTSLHKEIMGKLLAL